MMGYVLKVPPGWLCLCFALINFPMFSMEMKYIFTGSLSITAAGDAMGPCEIEIILTLVFLVSGIFGVDGLGNDIGESIGV